jgi:hypothetical protein
MRLAFEVKRMLRQPLGASAALGSVIVHTFDASQDRWSEPLARASIPARRDWPAEFFAESVTFCDIV